MSNIVKATLREITHQIHSIVGSHHLNFLLGTNRFILHDGGKEQMIVRFVFLGRSHNELDHPNITTLNLQYDSGVPFESEM